MRTPSPRVIEVADAIVRTETSPDHTDAEQLTAAERLVGAVQDELVLLIGGAGFHTVLDRSFRRATGERGFAQRARDPRLKPDTIRDLRADMQGVPAHDIHGALVGVFAELIALLTRLIGADLTARLVHRTWPDAVPWLTAAHLEDGDG